MILYHIFNLMGVGLVVVTLPLLAELLVLTVAALLPEARTRETLARSKPFPLAVLIPAHNEEALIGRCLQAVLHCADADTEVLVVAHNCTDATAKVAESAGARVICLDDPAQVGKGCALRCGFAAALAGSSQAVLVIDADSVIGVGLIASVKSGFLSGAQALQCRYEVYNPLQSQSTGLMALAFQGFNVIRPRGRAHLGLSAGILGNGFALRREVLTGVPYSADSVVEDLEYHLNLVRAGFRVKFVDTAVVRGAMPVSDQGARTQRARWEGGRMRMMRQWTPRLMANLLQGQIRMLEPLLDLLALPIAMGTFLLLIAACLPIAWLRMYALGGFLILMLHVIAAAACGSGFWGSMRVLAAVPGYIFWKLCIFPKIMRTSRANSAWVRTDRDVSENGK